MWAIGSFIVIDLDVFLYSKTINNVNSKGRLQIRKRKKISIKVIFKIIG